MDLDKHRLDMSHNVQLPRSGLSNFSYHNFTTASFLSAVEITGRRLVAASVELANREPSMRCDICATWQQNCHQPKTQSRMVVSR